MDPKYRILHVKNTTIRPPPNVQKLPAPTAVSCHWALQTPHSPCVAFKAGLARFHFTTQGKGLRMVRVEDGSGRPTVSQHATAREDAHVDAWTCKTVLADCPLVVPSVKQKFGMTDTEIKKL